MLVWRHDEKVSGLVDPDCPGVDRSSVPVDLVAEPMIRAVENELKRIAPKKRGK